MAASFPGAVKSFSTVVNGITKLVAALFNSPYDEITAIETELGTDPAGSMSDLKTRLAVSMNDNGTLRAISSVANAYTATNGGGVKTVAHGLGRVPVLIIIFEDGASEGWTSWFTGQTVWAYNGSPQAGRTATVDVTNFEIPNSVEGNNGTRTYKFICF